VERTKEKQERTESKYAKEGQYTTVFRIQSCHSKGRPHHYFQKGGLVRLKKNVTEGKGERNRKTTNKSKDENRKKRQKRGTQGTGLRRARRRDPAWNKGDFNGEIPLTAPVRKRLEGSGRRGTIPGGRSQAPSESQFTGIKQIIMGPDT